MEQNTRALLINWAKIKDRIPIKNEDKDPLYIKKLVLLYSGKEALGENTYEEWSKEAETRLASTLNQADPIPLQYKADSVEILAECVLQDSFCGDNSCYPIITPIFCRVFDMGF